MATIKQVAERAGVSVATVSYVVNETRKVRPATEQRVLAAVKELGYLPNATARNLSLGRSSIVGLVVPDIRNPFFPEITTAFQEAAGLAGIETIVINTNHDIHRMQNVVARLVSLQVPGVAFFTSQVDAAVKPMLAQRGICAVYLDSLAPGPLSSGVTIDYAHGIATALDHLLELGHRRIGFIGGPEAGVSARKRKAAFLESAAKTPGLEVCVQDSDFTVQGGYFSCSKLLNRFAATALMTANDLMAIGALHCAHDRDIKVPERLSIVGFDDIMFAQLAQPPLTTVAVPRQEIGQVAFQKLWGLIRGSNSVAEEYQAKTHLVVRESTGPPGSGAVNLLR